MKTFNLGVTSLVAAVVVVTVGAASAFGTVRDSFPNSAHGKVSRTVEGVRFSFSVPRSGDPDLLWANGPLWRTEGKYRSACNRSSTRCNNGLLISKSTVRGQSAEAVIFWVGVRDGGEATLCTKVLSPAARGSTADLAAAVAKAPGTKVVKDPTLITIGGRPAQHVVLTVREDLGCDPGFFFTWRPRNACWGTCWLESSVGDTIRVWIVDVGGTRLFIEAETAKDAGSDVEQEITKIIGSIRFD